VSLWDEGGGSPWQSFYRGAKVWPTGQGRWSGGPDHVAKSSPICPQGAVLEIKRKIVEGKKGQGRRPAINHWPGGQTWPPLE
jgi:hypothetical protein